MNLNNHLINLTYNPTNPTLINLTYNPTNGKNRWDASMLTFSLQTPLTTSDILFSKTSSSGILDELPGKGGKFVANKSNFGVGAFASGVEGWGL